jgi:hypothetical protein
LSLEEAAVAALLLADAEAARASFILEVLAVALAEVHQEAAAASAVLEAEVLAAEAQAEAGSIKVFIGKYKEKCKNYSFSYL